MSLFGSLMGDFDDDLGMMGNHMNAMNMQMRQMNRLMNSFMPDPFNMLAPFDAGFQQNALMERANTHAGNPMGGLFGFPAMPNMNRLLSADIGAPNGASYCSSSVITMSSGPDGRPQIYQATSSTKTGPGGIRETRKTVEDSRRGMKKMAIGHHIGERSHIIEKEQDLRSGQLEERQEFINLDEDEAEDFDREFTNRSRMSVRGARPQEMITIESADDDDDTRPRHYSRHHGSGGQHRRHLPALPAPPQQQNSSPLSTSSSVETLNSNSNDKQPTKRVAATTTNINKATLTTGSKIREDAANTTNNNSYLTSSSATRRSPAAGYQRGISARRPLRTPPSSPLATAPTNHSHSTAPTTSVHPHPYNAAAARRNYRSKHTKQHQQPHQPQTLTITEIIDDDDDEDDVVQTPAGAVIVEEEEDDDAAETTTVINPAAAAAAAAAGHATTANATTHTSTQQH
ncbi:unnamed protein product [Ceratitis capitata]|uniref:(Mediterranean fruit fly) hypothetical protein n=1 Tax=Ceratitis capitata TaxID=7213 RepID=A0A811VEE3_CERCA|nr:unnamed protein product [Ceratitis capitata]